MSVPEFFDDLAHLNFSHALKRAQDWWNDSGWPGLKNLVRKAATEEGKILEGLIPIAVNDVVAGGLTSESFIKAGKDVLAELISKNITTFNMQYVMALINAEVAPLAPPAQLPEPTPTAA